MSQKSKIIVGIAAGAFILCVGATVAGIVIVGLLGQVLGEHMFITDPAEVADAARSIAEYDLPPGPQEQTLLDFGLYKALVIAPTGTSTTGSDGPLFMLMQMSSASALLQVETDDVRREMQANAERRFQEQEFDIQFVGEETVTIGEQEVGLTIFEGSDGTGGEIREVISEWFEVKGKPLMLMIIGSPHSWDEEEVIAFIESIH